MVLNNEEFVGREWQLDYCWILMCWILLGVPIFPRRSENSQRNEFSFDLTLQIRLISFRFSHDSSPRMGTDFISTTLEILFLCSRVREHLIITEFRSYFKQRVLNSQCGNRLWLEFLVDFDWNYVTLCASINFIRNWKSVGGKSNWPNRDLVSHFIYIIRVFDDNCFYNILKIGRLLAASLGLLDFEYLFFFDLGENKLWNGFFLCNVNTTCHMLGIMLWDGSRYKISIS